ncbi:uncharacterized protein CTRU02_215750 [Colletotrichum truncatum]|uniref:Uncharacterized protein n=1 Tax=Colletotrichum truncatum TaxID=5467 RepID=A0ACC3YBW8_COLTU
MASKTITDRSAAARQVYRFRAHLLENDAQSKKLAVIDDVDPGHEYLKALGWDEVPDGKVEEGWRKTWDDHKDGVGNFGTWMNVHFKRWREQWVKLDEEAARRTEAQSASDAEVPQLDADPVLGQEFPTLAAAAVDIEQQTSPPAAEVAAEQIVAQGLSHGQDGAETRSVDRLGQAFLTRRIRSLEFAFHVLDVLFECRQLGTNVGLCLRVSLQLDWHASQPFCISTLRFECGLLIPHRLLHGTELAQNAVHVRHRLQRPIQSYLPFCGFRGLVGSESLYKSPKTCAHFVRICHFERDGHCGTADTSQAFDALKSPSDWRVYIECVFSLVTKMQTVEVGTVNDLQNNRQSLCLVRFGRVGCF